MAVFYFDSSSLVKLYIAEPGTEEVIRLARSDSGNQVWCSSLTRVEVRSAIARKLRRQEIDPDDAAVALQKLDEHWRKKYIRQPVTEEILDLACTLLERHGLRAYDAVQLASCSSMQKTIEAGEDGAVFVCSDMTLLDAATAEGLATLDPEASAEI